MTDEQRIDTCQKDVRRLEEQIAGLRDLVTEQFRGRDKAVEQAMASMNDRLATMNEFRGALEDAGARSLGREEYRSGHEMLVMRLNRNDERVALLEGRGMTFNVVLPAFVSLFVAGLTLLLHVRF